MERRRPFLVFSCSIPANAEGIVRVQVFQEPKKPDRFLASVAWSHDFLPLVHIPRPDLPHGQARQAHAWLGALAVRLHLDTCSVRFIVAPLPFVISAWKLHAQGSLYNLLGTTLVSSTDTYVRSRQPLEPKRIRTSTYAPGKPNTPGRRHPKHTMHARHPKDTRHPRHPKDTRRPRHPKHPRPPPNHPPKIAIPRREWWEARKA